MARRSTQQIIDDAEALAAQFEMAEPVPGGGRDAAPFHAVKDAFQAAGRAQAELVAAVSTARSAGISWALIGSMLGTSRDAARQRYVHLVEPSRRASGSAPPTISGPGR